VTCQLPLYGTEAKTADVNDAIVCSGNDGLVVCCCTQASDCRAVFYYNLKEKYVDV